MIGAETSRLIESFLRFNIDILDRGGENGAAEAMEEDWRVDVLRLRVYVVNPEFRERSSMQAPLCLPSLVINGRPDDRRISDSNELNLFREQFGTYDVRARKRKRGRKRERKRERDG